eukprot:COSAG05_NODE_10674_length_552_cov_1.143488_1_plen_127_part_10
MPPRAKRKRTSPSASPATSRRTRSSEAAEAEEEAPVQVTVTGHQPLPDFLAAQRQRGQFLDVALNVGDVCIAAHKCVIVGYSPYLAGLFTSGLAESSQAAASGPTIIQDIDGAAVAACVDCMYSGSI